MRPLAAVIVALALTSLLPAASGNEPLTVHLRVALVVFDSNGVLSATDIAARAGSLEYTLERRGAKVNVTVHYTVSVDPYQAPPGRVEALRESLSQLYEYPAPSGPRGPGGAARVPLVEAYWTIYREARLAIIELGGDPDSYHDILVIIGDLDGVARYYTGTRQYPYVPSGYLHIESVRGWGGYAPMTFYDLAAVQAEWPYYKVPFYNEAPPASPETEPLIWSLEDPEAYAAGLLKDHVAYHLVGESTETPLTLNLTVHAVIVDFGNQTATMQAENMLDPGEAERLARALAPWIHVRILVETTPATEDLIQLYNSSPRDGEFRVLEYSRLDPILDELAKSYTPFNPSQPNGEWTFFILATPEPAYLTYRGQLNFTGYSGRDYGATTIPGLDYRVYRGGLPAVVAHEVGHLLGEGHPFMFQDKVRWLMDMQATIMSYYDDGVAFLGDYYHYSALRISILQAIQYAQEALNDGNKTLAQQALEAVEEGDGARALRLALEANNLHWNIPSLPIPAHTSEPSNSNTIIAASALAAIILAVACLLRGLRHNPN